MNKQLTSPSEIWTTSGIVVFQLQRKTNDTVNIREMKIIYQLLLYRFSFCFFIPLCSSLQLLFLLFSSLFQSALCPFSTFLFVSFCSSLLYPSARSFSIYFAFCFSLSSAIRLKHCLHCFQFSFCSLFDKPVSYQGQKWSGNYVCSLVATRFKTYRKPSVLIPRLFNQFSGLDIFRRIIQFAQVRSRFYLIR